MNKAISRKTLFAEIKKKYKVSPEYPWSGYDTNAVFRHPENRKWFALVMDVDREKLGRPGGWECNGHEPEGGRSVLPRYDLW